MTAKTTFSALLAAAMLWNLSAAAHDGETSAAPAPAAGSVAIPSPSQSAAVAEEERARSYFTDLPVVTHDGETVRFFTDVLRGRVVLVTFFFTSCKGICPITNQKLAQVQDLLGDRLGRDIFLISISVDPKTDTPETLQEYRRHYGARDGWIFLTGDKPDVERITRRMGQTYEKEAHLPLILMGNVRTAHWKKLRPNLPEEAIAMQLRLLADEGLTATQ